MVKRIIPCLDFKGGRVVKGVKFVGLRDVGDPVEHARIYEAEGADELAFLDITASYEQRGTMLDAARRVAEVISIPFTVGGGIHTLDDIAAEGFDVLADEKDRDIKILVAPGAS